MTALPKQKNSCAAEPAATRCADPYPTVTADAAGTVLSYNERAAALLPGLAAGAALADAGPAWLAEAHLRHAADGPRRSPPWAAGRIGELPVRALAGPGAAGTVTWWLVDDAAPSDGARERERAQAQARAGLLQELSADLLASLDVAHCREVTVRWAARRLADAAVLVGTSDGRTFPVTRCGAGGPVTEERIALDPGRLPGLAEALRGLPGLSSLWADPRTVPPWAVPEGFADEGAGAVGSVVAVPLPGHGAPAGCLVLLRRPGTPAFTPAEERFARLFAARAGAALSLARSHARQARFAEVLTRDLLPPDLGRVHGVCFSGRYRSSTTGERVGGDFYDLHPGAAPQDGALVVLGDVCGKGIEAAVVAGRVRHAVQALLPFAADHTRLLTLLNSALLTARRTPFVTLVLVGAVREGDRVRLRVTSAGHPAPLVVRATGRVEEVPAGGTLLGAVDDLEFTSADVVLEPGETCLLYSDGITEARGGPLGGVLFGEERLRAVLAPCAGLPPEAVTERVQMIAAQWLGEGPHDDMAVLAIGAPGRPSAPPTDRATPATSATGPAPGGDR
ncbi:PP2C family protein-serine/threonine phosphatase [Streptomyces sp. NPDC088785]|uniref:PP2C family protein-serine/threonine phosphatase n=1 Tax=Streptomyces sp. NPDC088785 TaxID=3365897 RepID=UPI0037FBF11E